MKAATVLVGLALGLAACGGSSTESPSGGDDPARSGGVASGMWVVASHPEYHWRHVPAAQVPWSHITHLFLSFLEPAGRGGDYRLEVTGYGPQTLTAWKTAAQDYIAEAHTHGVTVICDLGGAGLGGGVFGEATADPERSDALAEAIAATLRDIGFDGVDLDWEQDVDAQGVVRLLRSLRGAWPDGVVTVAVGPSYGDHQVAFANTVATAANDVDAVMLMTYIAPNQTWTWWVVPVPITPLHGAATPWGGRQPYSLDRELAVWTAAGVPASKLVMGVGGFGAVWADTNGDGIAPVQPYSNYDALVNDPTCSSPPWTCAAAADTEVAPYGCTDNHVTQTWVDQAVAGGDLQLEQDDVGDTTYWRAPARNSLVRVPNPCGAGHIDAGLIFYETPQSMDAKVSYATGNGMRGLEFWTLSQMRTSAGTYPNLEAVKP
jgi:GH18 family chitinase